MLLHVKAVKLLLIAHDLLEHLLAPALVEQESAVPILTVWVLFRQEEEEFLRLVIRDTVLDKCLVQGTQVLEGKVPLSRVFDDELDKVHKTINLILVRPVFAFSAEFEEVMLVRGKVVVLLLRRTTQKSL